MRIIVTGDTGYLASFLIPALEKFGHQIYGLSRHSADIKVDVAELDPFFKLPDFTDMIIHTAASMSFDPRDDAKVREINYAGAANMMQCAANNGIKHFCQISTAYLFANNAYERSKLEAEYYAAHYCFYRKMALTIFRPSILVSDTKLTSHPDNCVYIGLKMIQKAIDTYEQLSKQDTIWIEASPDAEINVVPVDIAAENIAKISSEGKTGIFYITNPHPPRLAIIESAISDALHRNIKFVEILEHTYLEKALRRMMRAFLPYLKTYNMPCDIDFPEIDAEFMTKSCQLYLSNRERDTRVKVD